MSLVTLKSFLPVQRQVDPCWSTYFVLRCCWDSNDYIRNLDFLRQAAKDNSEYACHEWIWASEVMSYGISD
jgi:hypothetical protein